MYLEKLNNIMTLPSLKYNIGSVERWNIIETQLRCNFPNDYKEFINAYGTGGINNFLWILTPFENDESINIFSKLKVMEESYNYMKVKFPDDFKNDFYPNLDGLLPWGYTENGDELYWKTTTDHWSIVIFESRYANVYEYEMGMVEFLFKILNQEIKCNAFPEDFILMNTEYYAIQL